MGLENNVWDFFREKEAQEMRVFFDDGEIFELKILSTSHLDEGDDVVADIIKVIASETAPATCCPYPINFHVMDVARVESLSGDCLFVRQQNIS